MLFMIHADIIPENRNEVFERFLNFGVSNSDEVEIVGHWFAPTLLETWIVVEATDSIKLGKILQPWTDLNVNHVTPVMNEEQLRQVIS